MFLICREEEGCDFDALEIGEVRFRYDGNKKVLFWDFGVLGVGRDGGCILGVEEVQ